MDITTYCRFYGIDPRMAPIMEHINKFDWYVFQSLNNILTTGYYSGTGKMAKRVDLTDLITKACVKAGIKFRAFNDAPRGGVTGNKVEILW